MSEDANEVQETTPEVVDAPESQPAEASDTPAAPEQRKPDPAPQSGQQHPPMIPKWRFDEVNEQLKLERQRAQGQQQGAQQPPKPASQPPKEEDFANWQDFQDARSAYIADQRYEQRQQQEKQAQAARTEQEQFENAESNLYAKVNEVISKYPDFMQVVTTAPKLQNPYTDLAFKSSPNAGELAYYLGKNPETVLRLNAMHPIQAAAELGRIEGKLTGTGGQPKVSQMPKPMTPINGGKSNAGGGSGLDKALSVLYPNS